MKTILILVEGQTEETFVRDVLNPQMHAHSRTLIPTLVVTKRVKSGPNFKGGIVSWEKVYADLRRLLCDTNAAAVTTMFDYYALPAGFPGMATRPMSAPATERAKHVETAMGATVGDARFIPYLSLHEFEALVFASLDEAGWVFEDGRGVVGKLDAHLHGVSSPEDINEHPLTAPSKRIVDAFPQYQKVLHGPMAVEAAGLPKLRDSCPHFNDWLSQLESV